MIKRSNLSQRSSISTTNDRNYSLSGENHETNSYTYSNNNPYYYGYMAHSWILSGDSDASGYSISYTQQYENC